MKKRTKFTLCAAAVLTGALVAYQQYKKTHVVEAESPAVDALATPQTTGALHVEGSHLVDANGKTVQLKGISTHGIAWYPQYVNEECFAQFRKEWNANLMRITMYTDEEGGYCTNGDKDALRKLVHKGVACATKNDMYVIIDWHILHDGNPLTNIEEAKAFFQEMSQTYAGANNVFYEICNEPNGGTTWEDVKAYAKEIIEVIRANDEDGIIIVGTPNWCQYVDQAAADPITGYENIMYALHFYAATHKDDLRQKMVAAMDAGLPIFVTEYGICDASGNGVLDIAQANAWVEAMDAQGISYAMWNLSNRDESSAIVKPECEKTADFTDEDLRDSGKWVRAMLKGEESPGADLASAGGTITCGAIEVQIVPANRWEADGQSVCQYTVTLTNTGDTDCASWEVEIPFSDAITFSDGWNGDYAVEGNTLRITSKEYNGAIAAGASLGDVGFILAGAGEPVL